MYREDFNCCTLLLYQLLLQLKFKLKPQYFHKPSVSLFVIKYHKIEVNKEFADT